MRATMPRSCVMSRIAIARSACSFASRSRICAWMVTSSAVVGSSAISTSGSAASARRSSRAASGRRRAGTDTRRSAARHRVCRPRRAARARAGAPRRPQARYAARCTSMICRPTVSTGLSAVAGSWKIIATRRPRTARIAASGSASRSCRLQQHLAVGDAPGLGQQAQERERGHRLAAARFAHQREALAPCAVRSRRRPPRAPCRAGVSSCVRRLETSSTASAGRSLIRAPADRSRRAPRRRTGWPPAPART